MDAEEDGDAVVAVGHVGGHALLQEETESGADTRCSHEQKKLLSDSRAAARCSHALQPHTARLSLRSFFGFYDFKFGFM